VFFDKRCGKRVSLLQFYEKNFLFFLTDRRMIKEMAVKFGKQDLSFDKLCVVRNLFYSRQHLLLTAAFDKLLLFTFELCLYFWRKEIGEKTKKLRVKCW